MKTAISIPDPIFTAAEEMAAELAISRSELYAKAVQEFVAAYNNDRVTERLNQVYDGEPVEIDPVLQEMQIRSLKDWSW